MAACVKSFASLLLLIGVLSLSTVSAQGKKVNVTIVVQQSLKQCGGLLKIVGNSSEFGNSNAYDAPIMRPTPPDIWALTVTLTGGVTYGLKVAVLPRGAFFECYCTPSDPHVFTVPSEGNNHVEVLTGYECNDVPCPRVGEAKIFDPIRRVI